MKQRIIPSLTIRNNECWVTQKFQKKLYGGDPINAIRFFSEQDADELCVSFFEYQELEEQRKIIKNIVETASIPLTLAANFKSINEASFFIRIGADRIALTLIEKNRMVISEIIEKFGAQAVIGVIKYDSRKPNFDQHSALKLSSELEVSENLLIDVGRDGALNGFDINFFNDKIAHLLDKPCLIRGGVQNASEFSTLLEYSLISGVLASSLFSTIDNGSSFLLNYWTGRI